MLFQAINREEVVDQVILIGDAAPNTTYLTAFIAQAQGKSAEFPLRTSDVIHASRQALKLQLAADKNLFNVAV